MQQSSRGTSIVMSSFVPIGAVSSVADIAVRAARACASLQVSWTTSTMSMSISMRCSAASFVVAVRENVSCARRSRFSWSGVNFDGRVKSIVRSQRARPPPVRLSPIGRLPSAARSKSVAMRSWLISLLALMRHERA